MWWGPRQASTVLVFAAGDHGRADDPPVRAIASALAQTGVATLALSAPPSGEGGDVEAEAALREAVAQLGPRSQLLLGGFSRGGRVAAQLVAELGGEGLICLSYPFHARRSVQPGERLAVLERLTVPVLICQGTRDALGNREQVRGYALPSCVQVQWLQDGNHGLVPRKRTGLTQADLLKVAAEAVVRFVERLRG